MVGVVVNSTSHIIVTTDHLHLQHRHLTTRITLKLESYLDLPRFTPISLWDIPSERGRACIVKEETSLKIVIRQTGLIAPYFLNSRFASHQDSHFFPAGLGSRAEKVLSWSSPAWTERDGRHYDSLHSQIYNTPTSHCTAMNKQPTQYIVDCRTDIQYIHNVHEMLSKLLDWRKKKIFLHHHHPSRRAENRESVQGSFYSVGSWHLREKTTFEHSTTHLFQGKF